MKTVSLKMPGALNMRLSEAARRGWSPDYRLMAVAETAGSSFEAGVPAALFEIGAAPGVGLRHQYCVTSDGERFLVVGGAETQETPPITVVLNWMADLKK